MRHLSNSADSHISIKQPLLVVVLLLIMLIFITRGVALTHEISNHPDEHVFFNSTKSLRLALLGAEDYHPIKPYPEGAYLFYLPFQFISRIGAKVLPVFNNIQIADRIGAVFYFALGCILGVRLLYIEFGKSLRAVIIYSILMSFSTFQIEISRYGTSDSISFFLLMMLLNLIACYFKKGQNLFIYLSFLVCGILAAVKYPLIYFCVLPLCAKRMMKTQSQKHRWVSSAACVGALVAGFLLFSPAIMRSLDFLVSACQIELSSYQIVGNPTGVGTPLDNFLSLFVYHLFYSDFPCAIVVIIIFLIRRIKAVTIYYSEWDSLSEKCAAKFFTIVLPAVVFFFFAYNCFIKTLFFRTLYPYFCIMMLYAALGIEMFLKSKNTRLIVIVLLALMVLRGSYFTYTLSQKDHGDDIMHLLENHPDWEARTVTQIWGTDYISGNITIPEPAMPIAAIDIPRIGAGEFCVTRPFEHSIAGIRLGPVTDSRVKQYIDQWEQFKLSNQQYYLGCAYPMHYYWLFGFWLHGSTGTNYEFPTNYVYYRPKTE